MEKLSSSLAVLAEIFKIVVDIFRECCFKIKLQEYKLECKYSYVDPIFKTFGYIMGLKEVILI